MKDEEISQDHKNMEMAFRLKDEGNIFFKNKDYKKAISKYVRVNLYLKGLIEDKSSAGQDPAMSMLTKRKKETLDADEKKTCNELQAVVYLNLAVSFHIEKNFQKAIENAKKSIQYNPTIKGYYRLGQSYKAVQNFE